MTTRRENPIRQTAMVIGASCDIRIIGAATEMPTSATASTTSGERDPEPDPDLLCMDVICVTQAATSLARCTQGKRCRVLCDVGSVSIFVCYHMAEITPDLRARPKGEAYRELAEHID